jgi:hypothetical protein
MLHRLTRGCSRAARVCQDGQPAVVVRAARRSSRSAIAASSCSVVVAVAAATTAAACDFDESPRDAYGGITVIVRETDDFEAELTKALDRWRRDGVRGVWLEVPAALVKYLPSILDRGFTLRGGDATHVLCCAWLPGGESPLPPGRTPVHKSKFRGAVDSACATAFYAPDSLIELCTGRRIKLASGR